MSEYRQCGKPQYAGRRSARLSLLPFCQTASAFRLIYLFHTFFRCGVYRAMAFAPLRRPQALLIPICLVCGLRLLPVLLIAFLFYYAALNLQYGYCSHFFGGSFLLAALNKNQKEESNARIYIHQL